MSQPNWWGQTPKSQDVYIIDYVFLGFWLLFLSCTFNKKCASLNQSFMPRRIWNIEICNWIKPKVTKL
jgi:hypothetical protein